MEFRLLTQIPRLRHLVRPALVLAALGTAAAVVAFATGSSTPSHASFQLRAGAGIHPSVVKGDGTPDRGGGDAVHQDKSPPLRTIPPAAWPHPGEKRAHQEHPIPHATSPSGLDPVVQTAGPTRAAPTAGTSFQGLGNGFSGPAGTLSVNAIPPDDNGAVGPNHYVQVVNESLAVFSKTGTVLYGPVPTNTLWSGFGGGCQGNDDGDATVAYDRLSNRWVISQFSVSTTPYLMCVAVSTGADPTGSYNRYSFSYGTTFPDYPKLAVWPDAYYVTLVQFAGGSSYAGPKVCALDRAKMLAGQAATQQCFSPSSATNYGPMLPSDVDGATPPPTGARNYLLEAGSNVLHLWKFHVDWSTPANSSLSGPTSIPVASYTPACDPSDTCVPQSGTTAKLDALGDRLMYRLAYRNFGDHESLVVAHSVAAGSSVGLRWYEIRNPAGTPTVYQQGTYAPDSAYRWMGSIAMNQSGDIALGYSVSSSSMFPSIRYTGRLAGDALGQMTQGEGTLFAGTGSQSGGGYSRWGDYTSMSVDPSDDCTFWYTNQYIPSNGTFNWRTQIGSFKLSSCSGTTADDFSIDASPATLSIAQGSSQTSTVSTALTTGSAQSVSLSATGQPSGTTVSFSPTSVTAGGGSTMTVDVGSSTASGTYPITLTGAGPSATHSTTVTLTVTGTTTDDFSISASPTSTSIASGSSGNVTVNTAVTSGSAQSVSLSVSGQPSGSASFSPSSVTAGSSSTLTITVASGAATGPYTITITGTGASATHTTTLNLTVTSPSTSPVANGGFEGGSFTGWTASGKWIPRVVTSPHTGSYAAQLGSGAAFGGNSTVAQTVKVPVGSPVITFWYLPRCKDTVGSDQIQMQIRSTGGSKLATVLNVCSNSGAWTKVTYSLSKWAGQTIVLWFNDHDNGNKAATYFLLDDVAIS
jgi:hypothetical protein